MMFNPLDLTGKKILITGAAGGIGRASAMYLSRLGAQVILVDRLSDALTESMQKLEGTGHQKFVVDLTDFQSIPEFIKNSVAMDGNKFNGFLHCAGGGKNISLRAISVEALNNAMQVNFYAFIEIVKIITSKKYFQEGSIVAISSFAAMDGEAGNTAYSAAKAALDASVRTLSFELAEKKIRINSVRPGMVETDATKRYQLSMDHDQFEALVGKQILGLGKPDDVAAMCAYLLSDASRFLTGRNLYIDGGRFK